MEIEFGHIREYNLNRGFGFVSCTFKNNYQRQKKGVWFHIRSIKHDYPELAKELDSGSSVDINFWYEIDNSDREKVRKIWLKAQDIPQHEQDDLVASIEKIWVNIDSSVPQWLDEITLALVGSVRKNEFEQQRNEKIRQKKEAEEERVRKQSQTEKIKAQKQLQLEERLKRNEEIEHVYIGLPEHLVNCVFWVKREARTNILSHEPGGSDVVIEYYNGHARGYDWIKKPSVYIGTFFSGEILSVYARTYNDEEYSTAVFEEVWNAETSSEEMLFEALKKFDRPDKKRDILSILEEDEDDFLESSYNSDEVWTSWYNEEENQWYFGECPECNIPDRDRD